MKNALVNALISALMMLVLATFFMGLRLNLDGTRLVVQNAGSVRWEWIVVACAGVAGY